MSVFACGADCMGVTCTVAGAVDCAAVGFTGCAASSAVAALAAKAKAAMKWNTRMLDSSTWGHLGICGPGSAAASSKAIGQFGTDRTMPAMLDGQILVVPLPPLWGKLSEVAQATDD